MSGDRSVPDDHRECKFCGRAEPFHVHGENGVWIADYFTVGRGMTDFEAAEAWKARTLAAEAASSRIRDALVAARAATLAEAATEFMLWFDLRYPAGQSKNMPGISLWVIARDLRAALAALDSTTQKTEETDG